MLHSKSAHEKGSDMITVVLLSLLFAIGLLIAVLAPAVMYDLLTFAR
jgi:hypothetical protein